MNWSKTGKIKVLILAILFLPNLFMPTQAYAGLSLSVIPVFLIFGILAVPFIVKINSGTLKQEIIKPNWNENPLDLARPLNFFQFIAFFLIVFGLSIIIGNAIKFHILSSLGLILIALGIGLFIGILWKLSNKK